jgi:hypothetical protein
MELHVGMQGTQTINRINKSIFLSVQEERSAMGKGKGKGQKGKREWYSELDEQGDLALGLCTWGLWPQAEDIAFLNLSVPLGTKQLAEQQGCWALGEAVHVWA